MLFFTFFPSRAQLHFSPNKTVTV